MKHKLCKVLFIMIAIDAVLILIYHLSIGDSCLLSVANNSDHKIIAFMAPDTSLYKMAVSMMVGAIIEPHSSGKPAINHDKFGGEKSFIRTVLNAKDSSTYVGFVDSTLLFARIYEEYKIASFKHITEKLDGGSQILIFYHALEKLKAMNSVYLIKMSYQQMIDRNWIYEINNESFNDTSNHYIKL